MAFLKPKFKFGASGGSGNALLDSSEHERQEELGRLHVSTRAAKHFQKEVVKGVEGFVSIGSKQLEVAHKLAEVCKKYGSNGPSVKPPLSKATLQYSSARTKMEKERENLHKALATLVADPLKGIINGAPLKDARNLKQKYEKLRQDADSQAAEVTRRRAREAKESNPNPEQAAKLQAAEQKMDDIAAAVDSVGKSATTSMTVVESHQQIIALQKIRAMIEYERAYYQRVTTILDHLHRDIESQITGVPNPSPEPPSDLRSSTMDPHSFTHSRSNGSSEDNSSYNTKPQAVEAHPRPQPPPQQHDPRHNSNSFYATCACDFEGEDEGELTIKVGDEILVHQVSSSGWSEGECNGQSGWFPSNFVKSKELIRRGGSGSRSRGR